MTHVWVEVGVVVPGVMGPQARGLVCVEGGAGEVVGRGDPEGVALEDHPTLTVFGAGLPAHLGFFRRGDGQAEAPRPIRAAHATAGHADDAACEHNQEGRNEGNPRSPADPEGQAVRRGGHGQREDSGA